jgi:hypothetical protein
MDLADAQDTTPGLSLSFIDMNGFLLGDCPVPNGLCQAFLHFFITSSPYPDFHE